MTYQSHKLNDLWELDGYRKELPDGRYIAILVMLFNARIVVVNGQFIERGWCYANVEKAKKYFALWDGTGEPDGWHKNIQTQEYRQEEHLKET